MSDILKRLETRKNQLVLISEWLEKQPKKDREEWLEAFRRADLYSTAAILALCFEHGLPPVNENAMIRFRKKVDGYVSSR